MVLIPSTCVTLKNGRIFPKKEFMRSRRTIESSGTTKDLLILEVLLDLRDILKPKQQRRTKKEMERDRRLGK